MQQNVLDCHLNSWRWRFRKEGSVFVKLSGVEQLSGLVRKYEALMK